MRKQDDETSENEFSEPEVKFRGKQSQQPKKETQQPQKDDKKQQQPKKSNFVVRTTYTLIMLGGFFAIIAAGPFYTYLLILLISILMFQELLRLKRRVDKEKEIPLFNIINWHFFFSALYYSVGSTVKAKLPHLIFQCETLQLLAKYHNVIFFMLWAFGFVAFTLSLKPGYYRYQLRVFGWTHLGCFFIIGSTMFMGQNLFEGIIWFLLPATLVISNDIFAYIFGFFLGKHQLIQLSPKKTWEGFIGGAFSSIIWAFLISYFALFVPALICPQRTLNVIPFQFESCTFSSQMQLQQYNLPQFLHFTGVQHIYISEFNIHAMIMSLFASLIAPFGGFFASGIKRAIKIKDFGDVIPGHGGLIDRFDCQLIMGMFAYVYLHTIVLSSTDSLSRFTSHIDGLPFEDQLQIFEHLKLSLQQNGILAN
ncbi:hypothetical protein PPERSA_05253 [Pseudocohnilembus persalinus]|uniref:Phosphatidate cytidylyltransferase n=1 Tax=Pseudocohnilembus persalinus TaxID=266149 RepID=A0A0V0QY44_PSEPJ|nr:hypothetical protein PPERSA_05253 [Pseudocohnilembus persalinus]|eukprot:KRX07089.1 hypothetical protein PPERSA_05253 [Pseudocohnilembus persalinus]